MRATPTSTLIFDATGTGSGTQFESKDKVTAYVNGLSGDTHLDADSKFDAEL